MLARLVAAILIAVSALALPLGDARAEPRGRYRRGRGRPQIHQHFDNPLGSILGGIFGGWLAEQMRPDTPPPPPPPAPYYDDEEEDDLERDRR